MEKENLQQGLNVLQNLINVAVQRGIFATANDVIQTQASLDAIANAVNTADHAERQ